MHHSTRVSARQRRAWRPPMRTAAVVIGAVGLVLPSAASATSGSSGELQKMVADSRYMRSQGVPKFPDPTGSGAIPKVSVQQLGVTGAQLQSAEKACRRLLRGGAGKGPHDCRFYRAGVTSAPPAVLRGCHPWRLSGSVASFRARERLHGATPRRRHRRMRRRPASFALADG
jgi:hypothetical protein